MKSNYELTNTRIASIPKSKPKRQSNDEELINFRNQVLWGNEPLHPNMASPAEYKKLPALRNWSSQSQAQEQSYFDWEIEVSSEEMLTGFEARGTGPTLDQLTAQHAGVRTAGKSEAKLPLNPSEVGPGRATLGSSHPMPILDGLQVQITAADFLEDLYYKYQISPPISNLVGSFTSLTEIADCDFGVILSGVWKHNRFAYAIKVIPSESESESEWSVFEEHIKTVDRLKWIRKAARSTDQVGQSFILFPLNCWEEKMTVGKKPHPFDIYSDSPISSYFFVQMELCTEGSLDQWLERPRSKESFSPSDKIELRFLLDIIRGLELLHKYEFVHGNLKPENILITRVPGVERLVAKIGGFVFGPSSRHLRSLEEGYLTKYFDPPESNNFEALTTASDIYSLAVIFLTLKVPIRIRNPNPQNTGTGAQKGHEFNPLFPKVMDNFPLLASDNNPVHFPEGVLNPYETEFIARCTHKDPTKRHNIGEFKQFIVFQYFNHLTVQ